jgi:hypothetical protein
VKKIPDFYRYEKRHYPPFAMPFCPEREQG